MDTEFINAYIAKQKAQIDDLQTRLLLSETRLQIVESRYNKALVDLKSAQEELEALNVPVETDEVDTESDLSS